MKKSKANLMGLDFFVDGICNTERLFNFLSEKNRIIGKYMLSWIEDLDEGEVAPRGYSLHYFGTSPSIRHQRILVSFDISDNRIRVASSSQRYATAFYNGFLDEMNNWLKKYEED